MQNFIVTTWDALMDNRRNPLRHLDLASQHYFMQVLGWMWSMVFSLSFLSIYHFSYIWMAHLLVTAGVVMTVAVFHEAEKQNASNESGTPNFSGGNRCVWDLDREA